MDLTKRTFWDTDRGQAVRGYFEAYGAVVKERETTGDPAAIPAPDSVVVGGSRGAPSNVADILLKYTEVKRFLDRNATRRQATLMNFVYVDGVDTATQIQYVFLDGSSSEWLDADHHEPPLVAIREIKNRSEKVYTFDLNLFEAPELDEVAKLWRTPKTTLLKREHERCARVFAAFAGVK
ncbi:MAG: hypothetical protein BGO01_08945 [Armatimonadetes bacterium 55-13]|nr:hypothetical protein [Armatimonadota bacterium]ODU54063.1 MAG: hypothetical protein ABT09_00335 [bacterium SCN 57-13]OJU61988.1 MAG: hypothetical protein BGO01_08945 [Armatimonadetes bacterium 55-13]